MQLHIHFPWIFVSSADFSPPGNSKMKILIGVGAGVLVFMILVILWWKGYIGSRISIEKGNQDSHILM